jgi:ribosomal protein L37AE/L43A
MAEPRGQNLDSARPRTARLSRIDWSEAEIVFIRRPICPFCRSPEYRRTKTEANGDDSTTRKVICAQCSAPYKICIETPVTGNDD